MTVKTEQEHELLEALNADKKSIRLHAITKLARIGSSEKVIEALSKIQGSNDREASFFASQAISKIVKRTGISLKEISEPPTEELTTKLLLSPSKDDIPEILAKVRLESENLSKHLLPAIGVFISKHGDITDASFIEKQLLKEDSILVIPFIKAAERLSPQILPRALPNLLSSPNALVRTKAISTLRKLDPEEAERHFTDLLSSKNPENRLEGVGIAFQFPYERASEYIVAILPDETDKDVLLASQAFLASNPDMNVALSMLDSIDVSNAEQKSRLTVIFKKMCQALTTASIAPTSETSPNAIVKVWKKQRLKKFLTDIEIQLQFVSSEKQKQILNWINSNLQIPEVVALLDRLQSNPQTELLFKTESSPDSGAIPVSSVMPVTTSASNIASTEDPITPASTSIPEAVSEKIAAAVLTDDNSEKTQIAQIKQVNLENFTSFKSMLLDKAKNGSTVVRVLALNSLFRLHPSATLIELSKEALENENMKISTAGLKILIKLDKNYIKCKIESLLSSNDIPFRVRVLRFALKFSKDKAMNTLLKMLKSPKQNERSNAISCFGLCPFDEIEAILLHHLDIEDHPIIAKQIIDIFLSNPSQDSLEALDSIKKISQPALSMVLSQGRNDLFELLSKLPVSKSNNINVSSTTDSEKPYSVSNVRKLARSKKLGWQPTYKPNAKQIAKAKEQPANIKLIVSAIIALIFLAILPIIFLGQPNTPTLHTRKQPNDWRDKEHKKYGKVTMPNTLKMNSMCSIDGEVCEVRNARKVLIKHDGSKILVTFEKPIANSLSSGQKVKISILPYRITPSGYIIANGETFKLPERNK